MIVDAHHHLWRYRPGRKTWLEARDELAALRRDFLGDELAVLLRENGVERTVVVQAEDSLEESVFMVDAAREHSFIAGIVAWAPLDDPLATHRALDAYAKEPKVKGLRDMFIWNPDADWLVRPNVLEGLALAAARGYTWDSTAAIARHLEHVCTVAERVPELKQVIDHLGKPPVIERLWEPWASLMKRASEYPNVYVKLSAPLKVTAVANSSTAQCQRYVDHVLEHFGAQRVMIASNWPVSNVFADYATTWKQMLDLIAGLDATERTLVMGRTATRFYNLD